MLPNFRYTSKPSYFRRNLFFRIDNCFDNTDEIFKEI